MTTNSSTFVSDVCNKSQYYYEAIQINVNESGLYMFSRNSTVPTYARVYKNTFDPFNKDKNLYFENDAELNNTQFKFIIHLQVSTIYILLVLTNDSNVKTDFLVIVSGPSTVKINRLCEYDYYSITNYV